MMKVGKKDFCFAVFTFFLNLIIIFIHFGNNTEIIHCRKVSFVN